MIQRYARGLGCDHYSCPAGYKPIRINASCVEAADAVTGLSGCGKQPWKYILSFEKKKDRPTGCYTSYHGIVNDCGCGLYINEMETTSNATCDSGDCSSTQILCERDDEAAAELIAISGCEWHCPAGYEPIHDDHQCIQAAYMLSGKGDGCLYHGNYSQTWENILADEDTADKPEGCYYQKIPRKPTDPIDSFCVLRHNAQNRTSNSTCVDSQSTKVFCKKSVETRILVA